ncbi:PREDICTED: alpha-(1,3)-fucosyltransferase 9-like [Nanorana parkeri]|uniref:alpha-(1,3)-fucosyltransferase 9-like n=1 Tax=Nanorana parkeri TaxID=125878 RepID=UPI0008546A0E|nr:PREDICTED: alpha-(1,3)-fucosyltransferase 9-like [Nanorana parkeri]
MAILRRPKRAGGLALPDLYLYYMASHLTRVLYHGARGLFLDRYGSTRRWALRGRWRGGHLGRNTSPLLLHPCTRLWGTRSSSRALKPAYFAFSLGRFRALHFLQDTQWKSLQDLMLDTPLGEPGCWRQLQISHFLSLLPDPALYARVPSDFERTCLDEGPLTKTLSLCYKLIKEADQDSPLHFLGQWERELGVQFSQDELTRLLRLSLRIMIMKYLLNPRLVIPLILLVSIIISYLWLKSDVSIVPWKSQPINAATLKKQNEILVLVWVWPFGDHFPLDRCQTEFGISGCVLTANRDLYNICDAVVMHHVDIMYDKKTLPQQPRPNFQHWVWYNMEPPLIIRKLNWLDGLFNMTMTFRKDADIFRPYGQMIALKEPRNFTIPTKSKLAAWVVSKFYPGVWRTAYYEELKKYIPIDVYGKGHIALTWDDFHKTISQYKFYLAFENSIAKDYITEKLWSNAFGTWTLPVVLGTSRENYERFIPGDAFIHVNDFPSAKDLAMYLLELDKDDEKYKKYFNWRSRYYAKTGGGWQINYCQVCETLKNGPRYQVIPSIEKWFLEK